MLGIRSFVPTTRPAMLLSAASAFMGLAPAYGQFQIYTDQVQWSAGAGLIRTDALQNDAPGNYVTPYATSGGWSLSSLAEPLTIQVFDQGGADGSRHIHFRDFGAEVQFTFAGHHADAVGFNYRTGFESWQLKIDGVVIATLPNNTIGFIGVVSDAPVGAFVLTSPSNVQGGISVDNLSAGTRAYGDLHNSCIAAVMKELDLPPGQRVTRAQMETIFSMSRDHLISLGFDPATCAEAATHAMQTFERIGFFYADAGEIYFGLPVLTDESMAYVLQQSVANGRISEPLFGALLGFAEVIRNDSSDLVEARAYAQTVLLDGQWEGSDRAFADLAGSICLGSYVHWRDADPVPRGKLWDTIQADCLGALVGGAFGSILGPGGAIGGAIIGAVGTSAAAASAAHRSPSVDALTWNDVSTAALGEAALDLGQGRLEVFNIGSTGADGVAFDARGGTTASLTWIPIPDITETLQGARLDLRASSLANGIVIWTGSTIECIQHNDWWVFPDVGSETYLMQVVQEGAVVASFPEHAGMAAGTDLWPIGFEQQLSSSDGQTLIRLTYPSGCRFTIGDEVIVGNELRVIAEADGPVADSITSIRVTAQGVPSMVFSEFVADQPACPADFNMDGQVNSQDFFDFLIAFFAEDNSADFNTDGAVNSQDFFDFLSEFFRPCS